VSLLVRRRFFGEFAVHDPSPSVRIVTGARSLLVTRPDRRVFVSTQLPSRADERLRLFDHMAEVGTRLLLETDQYIILSGR
jgi:hypothetical protein